MISTKILNHLENHKLQTTKDIANKLNLDRHTMAKYLESLKSQGSIDYNTIGRAKLWYIPKNPLLHILKQNTELSNELKQILNALGDKVAIINTNKQIIWSNNKSLIGKPCKDQNVKACKLCQSNIKNLPSTKNIIRTPIKDKNNKIIAIIEIIR